MPRLTSGCPHLPWIHVCQPCERPDRASVRALWHLHLCAHAVPHAIRCSGSSTECLLPRFGCCYRALSLQIRAAFSLTHVARSSISISTRSCWCAGSGCSVCPCRSARHPLLRLLNGVLAAAVWFLLPSTLAADPRCFLSHTRGSFVDIDFYSHAAAARPATCCGLVVVAAARGVESASDRAPAVCLDVGSSFVLHALAAVFYI